MTPGLFSQGACAPALTTLCAGAGAHAQSLPPSYPEAAWLPSCRPQGMPPGRPRGTSGLGTSGSGRLGLAARRSEACAGSGLLPGLAQTNAPPSPGSGEPPPLPTSRRFHRRSSLKAFARQKGTTNVEALRERPLTPLRAWPACPSRLPVSTPGRPRPSPRLPPEWRACICKFLSAAR